METFKVEIVPDFQQRKSFDKVLAAAGRVRRNALQELVRQYNTISLFQSEAEVCASVLEDAMSSGLLECSVRHAVREAYAQFQSLVSRAGGGEIVVRSRSVTATSVEVPKDDVMFSTVEKTVRVPYVGAVRHRRNNRILVSTDGAPVPENVGWLLGNVTRMFVGVAGQRYFVLVDCREPGAAATQPAVRKRIRKIPEILK